MKTISVSGRAKTLNNLLNEALIQEIIIETAKGECFVLANIGEWQGFEVDENDDIAENKELIRYLADRRSGDRKISLSEARKRFGL